MEPERRIEKGLRAFAKKRSEQAGPPMELRPATRERLQREIARQAEAKSRGFLSQWLLILRPRLAFVVCFIALAIGAWVLWPQLSGPRTAKVSLNTERDTPQNQPKTESTPQVVLSPPVIKADSAARKAESATPSAPPAPLPTFASANRAATPSPNDSSKDRDRVNDFATQKQTIVKSAATPVPATNPALISRQVIATNRLASADTSLTSAGSGTTVPGQIQGSNSGSYSFALNSQTVDKKLAQPPSPVTSASARVDFFDQAKTTVNGTSTLAASQVFNRLEVLAARRSAATIAEPPATVLLSFRVEKNGNDMKVIDADGSVYTGSVQIAQQEPGGGIIASGALQNTPASRLLKSPAPTSSTYFFRVAGTNRNLNQNVVFTGNFIPLTNAPTAADARPMGGFGGGGGGRAFGQPVEAVLSHSSINGTLVVGDQKPLTIVATPSE